MTQGTINLRAHVSGTLALDLSTIPRPLIDSIKNALTLCRKNVEPEESPYVPFYTEQSGWMEIPRGFLLTAQGQGLLRGFTISDGRSGGFALAPLTMVRAKLGEAPFPSGQPAFVDAIVSGCLANQHGGLAVAPTRAGKTLCSLEAAARLGGSTLILVDRGPLLNQWVESIENTTYGLGMKAGVIREDRFDTPPDFPFVVGMVQTLARRQLPDSFRQAFRTVIVDECNSAPTVTTWQALKRVASSYVIGLTATPDRKDGLTDAIFWTTGPQIAHLERRLEADVHFLHLDFAHAKVSKAEDGFIRDRKPRMKNTHGVNIIGVEQSLYSDPVRVARIATEALTAKNAGRRVLIFVGQREHVTRLAAAIKGQGYAPGIFIGGQDDVKAMQRDICITTFQMAGKGIDFQPPFTTVFFAGPRADIRQAVGRVLNPQAPHRPLIIDIVDGHKVLIGLAGARTKFYAEKRFTFRNVVWPGEIP